MNKIAGFSLTAFLLLIVPPHFYPAQAASKGGTKGCGGFHNISLAGTEIARTFYRFRNYNSNRTHTITQITIFRGDGTPLETFVPGNFPADFDNVLGPNQTTGLNTAAGDVFGTTAPGPGVLQAIVKWEADGVGNDLEVTFIRIDNALSSGVVGLTRARDITECVTLK